MLEEFWSLAQTFVNPKERTAFEIPRDSTNSYMQSFAKHGTPRQADGTLSADYARYGDDWDAFLKTDYDRQARGDNFLIGSPQAVVDKIGKLREEGMKNFILWFNRGGAIPQKEVLAAMELFAAKVMPQFADRVSPRAETSSTAMPAAR
jgi:alkanesulfonate monooxygenase SsuD/methylene tetrahydromethanopterin reductase-like flavin-dependent oxidoreductase (luciferase family)